MKKFRGYLLENIENVEKYTIKIEDDIIEVVPSYSGDYIPSYKISDLDIITIRDEIFRFYESRDQECEIFIDTLKSKFFINILKEYLFLEEYSLSINEDKVDTLIEYMIRSFLNDEDVESLEEVSLKNINNYFKHGLDAVNFIF